MTTLPKRLIGLLAMACILVAARSAAHAQIFQSMYGGGSDLCSGVKYTPADGGSISVGTSGSFGVNNDVYVVKTAACGAIVWSNTYDLGGGDDGESIALTDDGGYIITGVTENNTGCCNRFAAFLLKLDPTGNVQWAQTYGGGQDYNFAQYDAGLEVIQNPNDKGYVVAGGTTTLGWNSPLGGYMGWIIRTDLMGQLLWCRAYGPQRSFFTSVTLANGGTEILAAGTSEMGGGTYDIFAVRVRDADGSFGATGWAYDMLPLATSQGMRIRECANGNIVIAGITISPTGNNAGYLLEVRSNGTYFNDRTYELNGATIQLNDVAELPSGDFVVVGTDYNPSGGFGRSDLLLMEIDRATFAPNWTSIHGGVDYDRGAALAIAPPTGLPSYDIYAAGNTSSFAPGSYLYLLRANPGSVSGCNDAGESLLTDSWGQTTVPLTFPLPHFRTGCKATASQKANLAQTWLCNICPVTRKSHDEDPGDIGDTHGGGDNKTSDVKTGENAGGMMMVQPNPVLNGEHFILTWHSPSLRPVTITVADLSGKVVYNTTEDFPMSIGQKTIETKGWANGTYMVRIDIDGTSETKRVVVIGR
ncbi:MAG: lipoprotein [Chlorobi bacterium]|nr:lipoprotein [Chlorobiota bacterium]